MVKNKNVYKNGDFFTLASRYKICVKTKGLRNCDSRRKWEEANLFIKENVVLFNGKNASDF
jgi:hypothetical protein